MMHSMVSYIKPGMYISCEWNKKVAKARTIRDAAVALNMMITIDDTWGCTLTTAQSLQLAASTPPDRLRAVDIFVEWINPAISEIRDSRMEPNGRVSHSLGPGNGLS